MKESRFQSDLIKELEDLLPGCIVMKLDANYIQGIPDLLILYKNKWAVLECKRSEREYLHDQRPNQDYYISLLDDMSFARFIFPENKTEVLDELQQAFRSRRSARFSRT